MFSLVSSRTIRGVLVLVLGLGCAVAANAQQQTYLGFDRNDYPGDTNLNSLRQTFSYTGYWLNNPPGAMSNGWVGKRPVLEAAGFGFVVLFNGRLYDELKRSPEGFGELDGHDAVAAAKREGFPANTIIFLDIEEGGRMPPEQKAYIYRWVDEVSGAGFRAGVYCSGIPVREDRNTTIVTADDIRADAQGRQITYWVTNDACPPSPGCTFPKNPPNPTESKLPYADIWQFVQSPKRPEFARKCGGYNVRDGNCYPPGLDPELHVHVDVNTANSPDPSNGR